MTGELPYAKKNFENFVNYEKDVDERFESGKRKPHTVFITNEIKVNRTGEILGKSSYNWQMIRLGKNK